MSKLNARILKEIKITKEEAEKGNFQFFYDYDKKYWTEEAAYFKVLIQDGAYKGQTHIIRMRFFHGNSMSFPMHAPNAIFITNPPYHVNISETGSICLDTLNVNWIPSMGLITVLNSILLLLDEPNYNSPYRDVHKKDPALQEKIEMHYTKARLPDIFNAPEFTLQHET